MTPKAFINGSIFVNKYQGNSVYLNEIFLTALRNRIDDMIRYNLIFHTNVFHPLGSILHGHLLSCRSLACLDVLHGLLQHSLSSAV